jgi:hypothetical protein
MGEPAFAHGETWPAGSAGDQSQGQFVKLTHGLFCERVAPGLLELVAGVTVDYSAGVGPGCCELPEWDLDYFDEYSDYLDEVEERPPDPFERQAINALRAFFEANRERVFTSRQVEVAFEDRFFHWITHRALKALAEEGTIVFEQKTLSYGAPINLGWHRSNRYTRRQVKEVMALVEQYSHPEFTAALGNTAELLVSDGFGRFGFVQRGRNAREFGGKRWVKTEHNMDFLFERDGRVYGVEVKNTLPYIRDDELATKLELCAYLNLVPVFVVRAMPKIWIQDVARRGGFTLLLKHHLYPLSHRALAGEVKSRLGLPADAPKALYDGTMQRFVSWHERQSEPRPGGM